MQPVHVLILVGYILLMVLVGAWFSRRKKVADGEDFMLAGRSLPAPVLAGTLLATFVGSGSIIGGASFVYTYGPVAGIFFFAGTVVGIICLYFMATKVRRLSHHTIPEMLEVRFGRPVRILATVIILVAFVGITAYQFTGAGSILSIITPLSTAQGTIVAAILITFLALGGGLKSVAWTDFISVIIIVLALVGTLAVVFIADVGGIGGYVDRLDPALTSLTGTLTPVQLLGYFLPLFLLILGDQNMHQRLAAGRSEGTARKATIGFFVGAVVLLGTIILLASSSSFLLPDIEPGQAILGLAGTDLVPLGIGGLLLAGAFALIVTTGSSYLLTCSGNIVYDLVLQRRNSSRDPQRALKLGRWAVLAVTVLAYVMGQFFPSVLALQMYAYTMYGVAITPVVLAALFWKRATSWGAIAGMVVGGIATVVWQSSGRAAEINAVVVALPLAVAALVIVSLVTRRSVAHDGDDAGTPASTPPLETKAS
ncbi:sodium:solute symporter family protein [Arthrobacter sp. NamB2]|uniref:sodium:solute symporter family protein n=1 Tax=Arthrobacter sp. NamB2 TaxID=2576035 RepID=UPI0010C9ED96|nr:sodium:solute symporter family protein [Arthrobacter sp. NamB2]TKV28571.1 sodium:solute symporter family protein [Arthrobacter sp. NamB2]